MPTFLYFLFLDRQFKFQPYKAAWAAFALQEIRRDGSRSCTEYYCSTVERRAPMAIIIYMARSTILRPFRFSLLPFIFPHALYAL